MIQASLLVAVAAAGMLRGPLGAGPTPAIQDGAQQAAVDAYGDPLPEDAQARFGSTRLQHPESVTFAAFLDSGRRVVSGARDGSVRVWDAATGAELGRFQTDHGACLGGAVEPGGERVAVMTLEGAVQVFDVKTGAAVFEFHSGGSSVSYSRSGKYIAAGGKGVPVRLVDATNGRLVNEFELEDCRVSAFALGPDARSIALAGRELSIPQSGSSGLHLRFFDTETGARMHAVEVRGAELRALALVGDLLVGGDAQGRLRAWTWDAKERVIELSTGEPVLSLAVAGDDAAVALGDETGGLRVVAVDTWREMTRLNTGSLTGVPALALSADAARVVCAAGREVQLFDVASGKLQSASERQRGPVAALAMTPDGTRLISAGLDQRLLVWDRTDVGIAEAFEGHRDWIVDLALSSAGWAATAGRDGTVRIWDLEGGRSKRVVEAHALGVTSVDVSPDGASLLSASLDRSVAVWDAQSGELRWRVEGIAGRELKAAFASNGELVLVGGDELRAYAAADGVPRRLAFPLEAPVTALAAAPGGTSFGIGLANGAAFVIDGANGKRGTVLPKQSGGVGALAFAPAGARIATACAGESGPRVWDADGAPVAGFSGHLGNVLSLAFSPDGETLASGGFDGSVLAWRVPLP